jgi:hypothetical protein
MNENKSSIEATISSVRIFALLVFLYMMAVGATFAFLIAKYHSLIFAAIGLVAFFAPIIFNKSVRVLFLKRIKFTFYDDFFLVEIFNYKTQALEKEYRYKYEDVESFGMTSNSPKTSTLRVFLSDSSKFECSFSDENDVNTDLDLMEGNMGIQVMKRLYAFNKKISLIPPLFATKNGNVALIIFTILFAIDVIITVTYKLHNIAPLISGAAFYVLIVVSRFADQTTHKNLKEIFK